MVCLYMHVLTFMRITICAGIYSKLYTYLSMNAGLSESVGSPSVGGNLISVLWGDGGPRNVPSMAPCFDTCR
jgi:hypothetical protein